MNRKALLLVELSVLILASMIIYLAVSKGMSAQNLVISRMTENNDVLSIIDSFASKIKSDYNAGVDYSDASIIYSYNEALKDSRYRLNLEFTEEGNAILVLSVYDSNFKNVTRCYRKEVLLNNE